MGNRRVGRSLGHGGARGRAELLDHPRIAGGLGCQQMGGDGIRGGALAGEQPRGARVTGGPLAGRDLGGHRRVHDRVGEAQRTPRPQDAGGRQGIGGRGRVIQIQFGERGDVTKLGVGPQHRERPRRPARGRAQAVHAREDRAGDRPRSQGPHTARVLGGRRDRVLGECARELADQKRHAPVASWQAAANRASGRLADGVAHQRCDPADAQRLRANDADRRVGSQLRERGRAFGGTHCQHEGHRQSLEAAREVAEEAQRGLVGPVGVVDREQQRRRRRELRDQPVQAVEDREGRVWARRRAGDAAEHRGRQLGGAVQQFVAPGRDDGFEELARHPIREGALELGAACGQVAHAVLTGRAARRQEQPRLADARRALDHSQRAAARGDRRQRRVQLRELALALEQLGRMYVDGNA
jgi:hypothetical protein